ncbi:MAG: hypothetical protein H6747_01835 [Deltaproteobacteria bacterium]|nr:hypothetical protein [Deltaproteobacteria bacterium]
MRRQRRPLAVVARSLFIMVSAGFSLVPRLGSAGRTPLPTDANGCGFQITAPAEPDISNVGTDVTFEVRLLSGATATCAAKLGLVLLDAAGGTTVLPSQHVVHTENGATTVRVQPTQPLPATGRVQFRAGTPCETGAVFRTIDIGPSPRLLHWSVDRKAKAYFDGKVGTGSSVALTFSEAVAADQTFDWSTGPVRVEVDGVLRKDVVAVVQAARLTLTWPSPIGNEPAPDAVTVSFQTGLRFSSGASLAAPGSVHFAADAFGLRSSPALGAPDCPEEPFAAGCSAARGTASSSATVWWLWALLAAVMGFVRPRPSSCSGPTQARPTRSRYG